MKKQNLLLPAGLLILAAAATVIFLGRIPARLEPKGSAILVRTDPVVGRLYGIPAGSFLQGSPETEPGREHNQAGEERSFPHRISGPLAVMETEVTRGMWARLKATQTSLPEDPSRAGQSPGPDYPVQNVSWREAVLFANLLSVQRGLAPCYFSDSAFTHPVTAATSPGEAVFCRWEASGFRLPTEGEWEYLCRAGTSTPFSTDEPSYAPRNCGNESMPGMYPCLEKVAWFHATCADRNGCGPAGRKAPNQWNLRDVHGNVEEWCWDVYGPYPSEGVTDYRGSAVGTRRVARGGGWPAFALLCRSAARNAYAPEDRRFDLGFRLVCRP